MHKRNRVRVLAVVVAMLALISNGGGTAAATANAASDMLAHLPPSDAVLYVNVNRLIEDVAPRLFAEDAATLASLNRELDNIKKETGFDPRLIDAIAVGMSFNADAPKNSKAVAVVRGRFDAAEVLANANARLKPKDKLKTQVYNNRTMYVGATPNQNIAVAPLDASAFVSGDPQTVREAIDCNGSAAGCAENSLKTLAASNKDAFLGYAGNNRAVAPLGAMLLGINSDWSKLALSVQEFNGSISAPGNAADLFLSMRTESSEQAYKIAGVFDFMKAINESPAEMGASRPGLIPLADGFGELLLLFKGLNVTAQGNEAQFRLEMPFARILKVMRPRSNHPATLPPAPKPPPPPAPRRSPAR